MPKLIPEGGKRIHQVKVNLNDPEKTTLDKLVKYYGSDSSRTLRQLLINWNTLEKYVVSLDEIISKVDKITENKEKILVILDSNHKKDHVYQELILYSK